MCGIAGLVAPGLAPQERLAHVRAMVARLRHRGPSGEAVWDGGECALGIARLAIVAPNQPARVLQNESGDIVGVANGELYNHAALLRELRGRRHVVPDGPDTAMLPHGASYLDAKYQVASLDHAMWFHDEFRADQWLLYHQHSSRAGGARGFAAGQFFTEDGRLVVTAMQEGLIRPIHAH